MATTQIRNMMMHGASQPKADRNPWRVCVCGADYNPRAPETADPKRCNACVEAEESRRLAAIRNGGRV